MRGDTEDVHPAGGVLDDEERLQPVQSDRVEVEQVAREDRVGMGPQELGPGWSGPSGRGVEAGAVEDGPEGGGADVDAETGELAVDGESAPWGAVAGFPRLRFPRPLSKPDVRLSPHPAVSDQLAVPAQDGGRRDQEPESSVDREQSDEGGDQGAVGPGHWRAWRTPLNYGELVAQHEDLDVLGGVGPGAQHDPAQEIDEHLVDQPQRHHRIVPGCLSRTNGQVRGCARSFGHRQVRVAQAARPGWADPPS